MPGSDWSCHRYSTDPDSYTEDGVEGFGAHKYGSFIFYYSPLLMLHRGSMSHHITFILLLSLKQTNMALAWF